MEAFAHRIVLSRRIDFCLDLPWGDTHLGVNHNEAAGEVTVFGRRNTAHHLDRLNVIGADLSGVGTHKCCAAEAALRHCTVVRHGHTVHDDACSEGVGVVVDERTYLHVRLRGEVGDLHVGAGNKLHDVVETESLQVVDGLTADDRSCCFSCRALLRHHFHVVERKRLGFHAEGETHVIARHDDVVGQRFIANVGHFEGPFAFGDVLESGHAVEVGGSVGAQRFKLAVGHDERPAVVVVKKGQGDCLATLAGSNTFHFTTLVVVLCI